MKVCTACGARFSNLEWDCPSCHHHPPAIEGYLSFAPELAENNQGFEPIFFSQLASLEAKNFWFRSRNRLIIWAIRQYFPNAESLLEIGCGTGFVLSGIERAFPKIKLYGSEIFSAGLGVAAQRLSRAQLFQMDGRNIPFENEFDVIGAFDVLEHVEEDDAVLSQIHRALHPNGGLILTVPQHPFLWSYADEYACHVRRYQAQKLRDQLKKAGFIVIKTTSFVSLLLPLMLISRWQQQKPEPNYDGLSELKLSRWLNFTLEGFLKLELLLIRLGCSLPAGGSLLMIASRT